MALQTKVTLKTYFQTGDIPTEPQYADLIDSMVNLSGDNVGSMGITGDITASGNISASGNIIATGTGSFGYVTAHEISASGDLIGNRIYTKVEDEGFIFFGDSERSKIYTAHSATDLFISASDDVVVQADDIELRAHGGDIFFMKDATTKPVHFNVSTGNLILSGSGGISSSGEIKGENIIAQNISSDEIFTGISNTGITQFQVTTNGISALGKITVPITASGHISGSSTTRITAQDLILDRALEVKTSISGSSVTSLTLGGSSNLGHITSSGNISASGNLYSSDLYLDNVLAMQRAGGVLNIGGVTEQTQIDARHEGLNIVGGIGISGVGHITSSGNISSSGDLLIKSITSSGAVKMGNAQVLFINNNNLELGVDNNVENISYGRINTNIHNFQGSITSSGNATFGGEITANGNVTGETGVFAQVNTGQGSTEVYSMNQAVTTTSTVTFSSLQLNANVGVSATNFTFAFGSSVGTSDPSFVIAADFPGVAANRASDTIVVENSSIKATSIILGSSNLDGGSIDILQVSDSQFKFCVRGGISDVSATAGAKFSFHVL